MRKPEGSNNNGNSKLRKGLWSPEEDDKLMSYMMSNGQGCWSDVARNAGLQRCGKSCRLRWINYLRPDLKRGAFSPQEEDLIIHLHSLLGNRFGLLVPWDSRNPYMHHDKPQQDVKIIWWSQIAARLPGRTDNEIKNFWNSTIKKRLKNFSSTTSPNASDTSSEPSKDAMAGGFVSSIQEHGMNMSMYIDPNTLSSSSIRSSSPMHAMVLNHMMDPLLPLLDHGVYFSNNNNATPCMNQIGVVGNGCGGEGLFESQEMYGGVNIGIEGEFNVPYLESITQESIKKENIYDDSNTSKYPCRDVYNINNNNNNNTKEGNIISSDGVENFWQQEEIKLGEWDLEDLMEDVSSSFPFLDFQS